MVYAGIKSNTSRKLDTWKLQILHYENRKPCMEFPEYPTVASRMMCINHLLDSDTNNKRFLASKEVNLYLQYLFNLINLDLLSHFNCGLVA